MPILAFNSTSILDSTSIGRDLLTAANQAEVRNIVGVDTGEDYTWTGDNTFDGSVTCTGDFSAVDGSFSGDVIVDGSYKGGSSGHAINLSSSLVGESQLRTATGGGTVLAWGYNGATYLYTPVSLRVDQGLVSRGDVTVEAGNSYKLYNLGDESATDQELLKISASANTFSITSDTEGAGVGRTLRVGAGGTYMQMSYGGSFQMYRGRSQYMAFGSQNISVYKYLQPSSNLGVNFGSATRQWGTGYFGNVAVSGNITAENLPTSDPGVPGQLYVTTGGALKVSQ